MFAYYVGKLGLISVDPLEWKKIKAFSPACFTFFIAIVCNMKLLQISNVDTFIMLRSTVPLATAFAEHFFLKTPFPNISVFFSLVMIIVGSVGFILNEEVIRLDAYSWGVAYVLSMVIDTVLVKKVVNEVELTSWGLVLYNNFIASAMYPGFVLLTLEVMDVGTAVTSLLSSPADVYFPVFASCIVGIAISFFGLNARKALSATSFSVLGVVCKMGTILLNTLVWNRHSSAKGIFFLCVCVVSGIMYQHAVKQSPSLKEGLRHKLSSDEPEKETILAVTKAVPLNVVNRDLEKI